ncbi:autophagy protein Atg8 ubiquitin-like protein (macronuclear) [Tetrahymena thermophila SB210]|uniref:Autophagy protein Atg8 ubiquitin-like protein n=1 Tax=Tetrahymena thermophila (strain SB210) TaxID=312017 RepID=I7M9K4_TETTS|nr:autophagy protein Atg8 ubiquitin-like protein [Tetrahymena thermophila SB210]EAS02008.2 autophagy protein Atg8 ubiquitin-like protein [Tetrahymena thermophila SB210]|eukprot:XP_001022253.2 autophagy protein Atg8 ubiquitin-like protein [Tetrahymena thermophila SB210]
MNQTAESQLDQKICIEILQESEQNFKKTHSFEERFIEYQIIRCNYPGFIPIACELENITDVDVSKHINFRFYVSDDIFVGHLKNYLKELFQKRIKTMKKSHRLHLLIEDDVIIKHDIPIKEVYTKKVEPDGWLYLKLSIDY